MENERFKYWFLLRTNMIKDLLILSNSWWKDQKISKEKAKDYHRDIYSEIEKMINDRQIIILTGLRRTGKSTILFQLIEKLLEKKDSKNIIYFNFDEKSLEPIDVLKEYKIITGADYEKEKCFVFFDEIQKLKEWSGKIKFLYDNLPNLKFFISGSASLMIEKESIHNLAGRYFIREINPLSLKEFSELFYGKKMDNLELFRNEIKNLYPHFIKKPFPEIVRWDDEIKINEYIKELIIDKIVKIDIPEIFDVNLSLLRSLTELFLSNPGMIINITDLAKEYNVHKETIQNHIYYLEFAKVIKICSNFRPSVKSESRKMKKIYPYNVSLVYPFYPELEKGKILESLISEYFSLYWREKEKEIDFIKKIKGLIPIEVKSKKEIKKDDLKNILYFTKRYKIEKSVIIYEGENKYFNIDDKKIQLINVIDFLFKEQIA